MPSGYPALQAGALYVTACDPNHGRRLQVPGTNISCRRASLSEQHSFTDASERVPEGRNRLHFPPSSTLARHMSGERR